MPLDAMNLSSEVGPVFWGFLISTCLYGIALCQGFMYFVNFPKDSALVRTMVALLLILITASTVLMGQCFNFYVIVNFGNTQALATLPGEFSAELVCTFTTTFIGQLFFARQVHVFRKTAWHLSVLITALSVVGFGFGTALCAELIMHGTTLTSTTVIKITASISLSANLLSNIIASGALCTLLTTSKKDVFSSTNGVLTKLTIYTLTRGLLVAFVQAGFLVTYVAGPDEIWWVPLHLILSKVYVNSLRQSPMLSTLILTHSLTCLIQLLA
ncbi:hypothetical protein SISSUDRAFT_122909 [Sistotremastrum suecicum HHB10207 ss-3]|uniref:DUF6534 domain-containing protein n=1 Tax=Sistotremastrum suecicum HHB10207 ss-3 TaxID=1314776 RepID=A0A166B000_9AGAM|nr:hypothetical protein SISSUDRAFT_122909 [Sistotremastrum suecicum HHB10207 ss-3]